MLDIAVDFAHAELINGSAARMPALDVTGLVVQESAKGSP